MTQHDPAAWMLSLSDEPATLTVLASITDVRQRGAFQAQYVHSRNGCAWADGTGDGSQWSPAEVAAWCVVNPADAIDLAHYAAQDAARLRKRLATILRLESGASDSAILSEVEHLQRAFDMEFA
mgnify:CR=1 FL=1